MDQIPICRYSLATEGEIMLKRSLVIATLILVQLGCSFKTEPYESIDPPQDARQRAELKKREFM